MTIRKKLIKCRDRVPKSEWCVDTPEKDLGVRWPAGLCGSGRMSPWQKRVDCNSFTQLTAQMISFELIISIEIAAMTGVKNKHKAVPCRHPDRSLYRLDQVQLGRVRQHIKPQLAIMARATWSWCLYELPDLTADLQPGLLMRALLNGKSAWPYLFQIVLLRKLQMLTKRNTWLWNGKFETK